MNISFEHIKENCETIQDVLELTEVEGRKENENN